MITIEDILKGLSGHVHGQIFLINLYRSLPLVAGRHLRPTLEHLAQALSSPGYGLPGPEPLLDRVREAFVSDRVWEFSEQPELKKHFHDSRSVLVRFTSYGGFYSMLNGSKMPMKGLPTPQELSAPGGEVDSRDVERVRAFIDGQRWKGQMLRGEHHIPSHCVWLTAYAPELGQSAINQRDMPNLYRDLIGLSHIRRGRHLVRLEVDLKRWPLPHGCKYRRPHGAGNGGPRFRVDYDFEDKSCRWGRTVDLRHVRVRSPASNIDGVPELVMGEFAPPLAAVSAYYVGGVTDEPESEDDYFVERLGGESIDYMIEELCREVTSCP